MKTSFLTIYFLLYLAFIFNSFSHNYIASIFAFCCTIEQTLKKETKQTASGNFEYNQGAIIRGSKTKKELALVFTADSYADGAESILNILSKYNIKASFFLTGNFYRNTLFKNIIFALKSDDHYLGAHSDQHLLYCAWENRDSLLVTKKEFLFDIEKNYLEMEKFGINKNQARYFLPPYEWYNTTISHWCRKAGLKLINFTPGTKSHADWTVPEKDDDYVSSEVIMNSILNYENKHEFGLNGFILLSHLGSDPKRKDKFYLQLYRLISILKNKEYQFKRIDELLK